MSATAEKVHWTKTPEGRARMSQIQKEMAAERRAGTMITDKSPATAAGTAADTEKMTPTKIKRRHWSQTPAGKRKMAKIARQRQRALKAARSGKVKAGDEEGGGQDGAEPRRRYDQRHRAPRPGQSGGKPPLTARLGEVEREAKVLQRLLRRLKA